MIFKISILAHFIFFACINLTFAQTNTVDHFHDTDGNTFHQLFVDFHIAEIIEMKYATDEVPVEGELSADGYSVIIKNYPGDKSVKLRIRDDSGMEKEIIKSRCFIDPVLLEL